MIEGNARRRESAAGHRNCTLMGVPLGQRGERADSGPVKSGDERADADVWVEREDRDLIIDDPRDSARMIRPILPVGSSVSQKFPSRGDP